MLYASSTLSLACLEVLVHVKEPRLPADYGWVSVDIRSDLMDEVSLTPDPEEEGLCRQFGSGWIATGGKAAIEVRSMIVPTEGNFLLNPQHPEFGALSFSEPEPFRFDPRLLKLRPLAV